MKDSIPTAGLPDDLVSREDEGLLAYINTLRLSVKEKVAAEQRRGLSLSEIVVQVREMVRVAERDANRPRPVPSRAFRAITRQALAWCVESYRPLDITAGDELIQLRIHSPNQTLSIAPDSRRIAFQTAQQISRRPT